MTAPESHPMLSFEPGPEGGINPQLTHDSTTSEVRCPVGGNTMLLVKSLEGVRQCLTDEQTFGFGGVPEGHAMTGAEVQLPNGGLLRLDRPELADYRNVLRPFFAKRYVERQRGEATGISQAVVDTIPGEKDVIDFHETYSYPFIGRVVCNNLGLPLEDWPFLLGSAESSLAIMEDEDTVRDSKAAWDRLYDYYDTVLDEKEGLPNDGKMISQLIHGFKDGDFSREEVVHALASVSNGYPAALPIMDVAMVELLRQPDTVKAALQNPEYWEDAVDEALRLRAHFAVVLPRVARQETVLEGERIPKGTLVLPSLTGAANDPTQLQCPEKFDPQRRASRSIIFGAGPHICPGATLTRQWLQVGLRTFFESYPDARLATEPERLNWQSGSLPTPQEIPVLLR